MNQYDVSFDKKALKHLKQLRKSGKRADVVRVNNFIEEIRKTPRRGIGKPEQMKHQKEGQEVWSRRINKNDRFVYNISENDKKIVVVQSLGHYDDK